MAGVTAGLCRIVVAWERFGLGGGFGWRGLGWLSAFV